MAFLISRLLCLVLVLNLANCQLPNQLDDIANQLNDLDKAGKITLEDKENLQNCMRKCAADHGIVMGRPGTSMSVDEAMVVTRCNEVHTFSVTCSFFLSGPWSDQQKTNALTKTTTCAVCTNKDKNLCVSHRVICKFF